MPLRIIPLPPGLLPRILLLVPLLPGLRAASQSGDCKLIGENGAESEAERGLLKKLEPLMGQSFSMTSTESSTMETYTYSFRVCAAIDNHPFAGLIQQSKKNETKVIGRINSTQIIGGSDWIILIYGDGDRYANHCNGEKRRGMVMISCDPSVLGAAFTTVFEERQKVADCFYLFELDSKTACPPPSHRLSPGSVLLILFLVLITVYILGGFLYQRLVIRAKGFEQFPNYYFWQELGNLTADGCDFVFRSKPRTAAAAYRGVGDEQLGEEDEEERDEHLLPM